MKVCGYKPGRFSFNVRGGAARRAGRRHDQDRCTSCRTSTCRARPAAEAPNRETPRGALQGSRSPTCSTCRSRALRFPAKIPLRRRPQIPRRRPRLRRARPAGHNASGGEAQRSCLPRSSARSRANAPHPDELTTASLRRHREAAGSAQRLVDAQHCARDRHNLDARCRPIGSSTSAEVERAGAVIATGTPEQAAAVGFAHRAVPARALPVRERRRPARGDSGEAVDHARSCLGPAAPGAGQTHREAGDRSCGGGEVPQSEPAFTISGSP